MAQEFQVGVVIPTFMRKEFLNQAIASVVEAWVTSGDPTATICITIVDDAHDNAIRDLVTSWPCGLVTCIQYLRCPDGPRLGPAAVRDFGITNTASEFIYLLDDDDQFLPNRFAQSLPLLRTGKFNIVLENSLREYDDGSDKASYITGPYHTELKPFFFLMEGGERSHITPGATAFTRAIYLEGGGYDPRVRDCGEDGELLLRLCLYGRVALLDGEPVCRISIHATNISRPENRAYWKNMFSLRVLYEKVRRERNRWPEEYAYLQQAITGKLDFALSQIRLESISYSERFRRGLMTLRYFPLDCLRGSNVKTLLVWLFKKRD